MGLDGSLWRKQGLLPFQFTSILFQITVKHKQVIRDVEDNLNIQCMRVLEPRHCSDWAVCIMTLTRHAGPHTHHKCILMFPNDDTKFHMKSATSLKDVSPLDAKSEAMSEQLSQGYCILCPWKRPCATQFSQGRSLPAPIFPSPDLPHKYNSM